MANDPKTKKNNRIPVGGEVKVTADADSFGSTTSPTFPATEDDWTEAEANAFMDELIERNKEALRGLAKL